MAAHLRLRLRRENLACRPGHGHQSLQNAQVVRFQRFGTAELHPPAVAEVIDDIQLGTPALALLETPEEAWNQAMDGRHDRSIR